MEAGKIKPEKAEVFDVSCSCGWEGDALVDGLDYYVFCRRCGKKIFGVTCPHCQCGFAYPEDYKTINKEKMTWRCEGCGRENPITEASQNNLCEAFDSLDEMPEEIKAEMKKRREQAREEIKKVLPIVLLISVILFLLIFGFFKLLVSFL